MPAILEAYDPVSRSLIATTRLPHSYYQFVGDDLMAVWRDAPDGFVFMDIVRVVLVRT
jgi:hypothetical protein